MTPKLWRLSLPPSCGIPKLTASLRSCWPRERFTYFQRWGAQHRAGRHLRTRYKEHKGSLHFILHVTVDADPKGAGATAPPWRDPCRHGSLGSVFAPFPSKHPDPWPPLALCLPENILFRAASLSVFQFDGDSAYVGMSDGNPELLSTSQVGAPSFLSWVGVSGLGLAGSKLLLGGRGTDWGAQPSTILFKNIN